MPLDFVSKENLLIVVLDPSSICKLEVERRQLLEFAALIAVIAWTVVLQRKIVQMKTF